MRLSADLIINYANINQFSTTTQWQIRAGENNTLYFQLTDLDQAGLRYLPGIGASNQPYAVSVKFLSIDNSQTILLPAVQADPADNSVWSVSLSYLQTPMSGNVLFTVYQGNYSRSFTVMNALGVQYPGNDGSC